MQAFIITDSEEKLSYKLSRETASRLEQFGWLYSFWPASHGRRLTRESWSEIGVEILPRGKIVNRPGAQGCFMSHWRLWTHCIDLNSPIVILEHDALAQAAFPENLDLDQGIWKLWKYAPCKINDITGSWSRGAWAYTITPLQARTLIDFTRKNGAQALDKQIGSAVVPWQFVGQDVFIHNPKPRSSTTSPHGFTPFSTYR